MPPYENKGNLNVLLIFEEHDISVINLAMRIELAIQIVFQRFVKGLERFCID